MAAQKKSQSTKKTTTQARKKSASQSAPPPEPTPQSQPVGQQSASNQFWSVILFALGVLALLLIVIEGTSAWKTLHNILFGLFGIAAIFIPLILIYTAVLIGMDKSQQAVTGRAIWGIALTFICSAVVQIFFYGNSVSDGFLDSIKELYHAGVDRKGGGLCSGIIAWPLLALFDEGGAKIIVLLLLLVLLMLLTNLGPVDIFKLLVRGGRSAKAAVRQVRVENRLLDEYDEEIRYEEEEQEREAIRIGNAEPSKRTKNAQRKNFDFDVPILESSNAAKVDPAEELIPVTPAWDEARGQVEIPKNTPADVEAPQLDALIAAATAAPTKKQTKQQESDQAAAEIEAEIEQREEMQPKPKEYRLPSLEFLKPGINRANDPNAAMELRQNADTLVDTLGSFGVQVRITGINRGPSVTRYEVQPSAGVKIAKITNLADDIALNLAAAGVRIEAPIPGKPAVGIEVPNSTKDVVSLREILESKAFQTAKSKLTFAIGKDIDGNIILGDIAKMPHMIIAGATGSGKSVCTNSIIMSLLYHAKPDEVKLVLIDPKIVEFKLYDGIPHLLIPVVTDPRKAAGALNWATQEMDRRYALCASCNVRDILDFNKLAETREDLKPLPQIVIVIDEFAELMMTSSKEVEDAVCRIAQKARAAGMHLIIATQRPTADVITGLIKSNVPSRIALFVKVQMDSRNILDVGGAEKLLGNGDMLYSPNGLPKPIRIQGCYCNSEEIERVVDYVKAEAQAEYSDEIMDAVEQSMPVPKGEHPEDSEERPTGDDELIERAIEVLAELGQASTSSLQRKLKLGYARAARIMDELEMMGIIGPHEGAKPRKVLITPQQALERKMRLRSEQE